MAEQNRLLVLIDDNRAPFWSRDADAWADSAWSGYSFVYRGRTAGDQTVQDVLTAVAESSANQEIYVVSDANLWGDPLGGSKVLNHLLNRGALAFGVVYSSEPSLDGAAQKSLKVIPMVRESPTQGVSSIREFFEMGVKPAEVVRDEIDHFLPLAVHRLENLAMPLRVDAGTLCDDPSLVDAVYLDYFSDTKPYGYLTLENEFPSKCRGLACEITRILNEIKHVDGLGNSDVLTDLLVDRSFSDDMLDQYLELSSTLQIAPSKTDDKEWIVNILNGLVGKIDSIANEIHSVRRDKAADSGGKI